MKAFALVRLGKDSVTDIRRLDQLRASPDDPLILTVECKQVPPTLSDGDYVFVLLGTNSSKGEPTPWTRGLRAFGTLRDRTHETWHETTQLTIEIRVVLPESINKKSFLRQAPAAYYWFSEIPMLGIDEYSNQTAQLIKDGHRFQQVPALLYAISRIHPSAKEDIERSYPELAHHFRYTPPTPITADDRSGRPPTTSSAEDNKVLQIVRQLLHDGRKLILFVGAPGTSKTHYAQKVVSILTEDDPNRSIFIQFHPSYSYDDFVQGYVPTGGLRKKSDDALFTLENKLFYELCVRARDTPENDFFLVIDEFSRGDASRIFGELLTYLEPAYRDRPFTLAYSGAEFSIPRNLIVIATMNPHDKSVSDIDLALDRRFAKIAFDPDANSLKKMLEENGATPAFIDSLLEVFQKIQSNFPLGGLGHAYFKDVSDPASLGRIWDHDLRFVFERALRFDRESYEQVASYFRALIDSSDAE